MEREPIPYMKLPCTDEIRLSCKGCQNHPRGILVYVRNKVAKRYTYQKAKGSKKGHSIERFPENRKMKEYFGSLYGK